MLKIEIRLGLLLLCWFLCSAVSLAQTQPTATIASTGNMNVPRYAHTATLLLDGRVLIAGGIQQCTTGCQVTATAELYDPATGKFTLTGSMTTPRNHHYATLLPDGTVYIVGSIWPNTPEYAEIYDPVSGTFSAANSLPVPINSFTSKYSLSNGDVLVLTNNSSVIVNPVSGAVGNGGHRHTSGARVGTPLADGTLALFPTGAGAQGFETETYSPSTNIFTRTPWTFASASADDSGGETDATGSTAATANLLPNGKVLLTLMNAAAPTSPNDEFAMTQTLLYDPKNGIFSAAGPLNHARWNEFTTTTTPFSDGTVLITGGFGPDGNVVRPTEVYDPNSGAFSTSASLPQPWTEYQAAALNNGDVLLTGGILTVDNGLSASQAVTSAEIYHPASVVPPPALTALNSQGQGAIWNSATGQVASQSNPVTAGTLVSMYTTSLAKGGVVPPQVSVGGRLADVTFFGDAPGYPGYFQVNFRVPNGVTPGPAVSVHLTYFGRSSNSVTMAIQ